MNKQTIRVAFGNFWPGFDPQDNYFTRVLKKNYEVVLSNDPELYFFTHPYNGKRDYLRYKCHRVFLGWENARTDWTCCDYALDSDLVANNPRHKRWPIWAAWNIRKLVEPKNTKVFLQKKKFACMVVSNPHAPERLEFFRKLSKYKPVDSGGRYLNNIGGPVTNKMEFIRDYKFVLSFENSSYPGYTTEKLIEPMLVNSIPVYWGNTMVGKDFNTKSFVHVNQYASFDEAIERIIELDKDDIKHQQLIKEPWFWNGQIPEEMSAESLQQFFDFVIKDMETKIPVGASFVKSHLHKIELLSERATSAVTTRLKFLNRNRFR
jgi:alpha(1,3/1,4) fucosyltransferase